MTQFAADEWTRATGALRAAMAVVKIDPNSAASRAYYAAYHAVTALFAMREKSFAKHSALRAAVHRDLVHTGEWPQELGQAFDDLLELRETGDYGEKIQVTTRQARDSVLSAHAILARVSFTEPALFPDANIPSAAF